MEVLDAAPRENAVLVVLVADNGRASLQPEVDGNVLVDGLASPQASGIILDVQEPTRPVVLLGAELHTLDASALYFHAESG